MPDGFPSIGDYAFSYCGYMTGVAFPNSLSSVGFRAFEYCYGLTDVTLPPGITNLEDRVFQDCSNLTSVVIHGYMDPNYGGDGTFLTNADMRVTFTSMTKA